MATSTVEMEIEIDVQDAYDYLTNKEREEFIRENMADCDINDLLSEVAKRCSIDEAIASFKQDEIEEWLKYNAEEYGYTKMEG